jgi:hypothetical protein
MSEGRKLEHNNMTKNKSLNRLVVSEHPLPFFKSLQCVSADLRIIKGKNEFLGPDPEAGKHLRQQAWFRLIIQALVTLILLGGGFYILLAHEFDETTKKIGSGFIGTAVGYWLR